jgi:hypothetical protein
MSYDYIQTLTVYECWLFYGDYLNNLMFERYLQNIPTDKKGNVITYRNDIFYLNNDE